MTLRIVRFQGRESDNLLLRKRKRVRGEFMCRQDQLEIQL